MVQSQYLKNLKQFSFFQTSAKIRLKQDSQQSGISEKKAQEIIETEFAKLDDHMKAQNEQVMEILNNSTTENLKMLEDSVKNMTVVVDKMVYHLDKKITALNNQLEENIQQTEEMSFLIVQDQLEKAKEEIILVEINIKELKEELGPLLGECDNYFSCAECQTNKLCGWCSMEQKCVLGDRDGPLFVACNFYHYDYCSGKECSQYTKCSSCISDPQCGWCFDQERLLSGCIDQPADYKGCPAEGWFHIEGANHICSKYIISMEEVDASEQDESWARTGQKYNKIKEPKEKEVKIKSEEDQLAYEIEKQKVLEDRQKERESVTPAEKRNQLKRKSQELTEQEKKLRLLKAKVKMLQKKYDDLSLRMKEQSDESDSDGEETEPEE